MERERFIPGIFNTCDYWCARCAFTRRCRNFAMGDEMERRANGTAPPEDAVNAAFWERLGDTLRETVAFGPHEAWDDEAMAEVDAELEPDPEWDAREEARSKAADRHPLMRMARDYLVRVHAWLKSADGDLKAVAQDLMVAARSRIDADALENEARDIGEMIEVIAWYHTLIPAKLGRAVRQRIDSEADDCPDILVEVRSEDANGTGKVVLIAIERSMAAWLRLRGVLPGHEDTILGMLALLDRMRAELHAALPGAASFRRPGFDD